MFSNFKNNNFLFKPYHKLPSWHIHDVHIKLQQDRKQNLKHFYSTFWSLFY